MKDRFMSTFYKAGHTKMVHTYFSVPLCTAGESNFEFLGQVGCERMKKSNTIVYFVLCCIVSHSTFTNHQHQPPVTSASNPIQYEPISQSVTHQCHKFVGREWNAFATEENFKVSWFSFIWKLKTNYLLKNCNARY